MTLLMFFVVFFMIVDFAITLYDRGTVINASRMGSRQASLYWVDPLLFDPTTPNQNQLLKRAMVDSVMTWTESRLLIDPGSAGLNMNLQINAIDMANTVEHISAGDVVSVDILYSHTFIGLSSLIEAIAPTLTSQAALGVE